MHLQMLLRIFNDENHTTYLARWLAHSKNYSMLNTAFKNGINVHSGQMPFRQALR